MDSTIITSNLNYDERFNKEFFKNLPSPLLHDRAFIKKALNYDPELLEFLPNEMRDDKELASIALNKSSYAYDYISERLKLNPDFIIPFIKLYPTLIEIAELNIRSNRKLILEIIELMGVDALWNTSPSLYHDVEIIVKALQSKYSNKDVWDSILTASGEEFKNSKEIIERAYKNLGDEVFKYSYDELHEKFKN